MRKWEMYHTEDDGKTYAFTIQTDPPEALYWKTYKLKGSHIKLLNKLPRAEAAAMRSLILEDILESEKTPPNPKGNPNVKNREKHTNPQKR
mgnify:FL=1